MDEMKWCLIFAPEKKKVLENGYMKQKGQSIANSQSCMMSVEVDHSFCFWVYVRSSGTNSFKKRWLLLLFHIICLIALPSSAGHDCPPCRTKEGETVTHLPYECSSWNSSVSQKSVPQFPVSAFTRSLFKMAFMGWGFSEMLKVSSSYQFNTSSVLPHSFPQGHVSIRIRDQL